MKRLVNTVSGIERRGETGKRIFVALFSVAVLMISSIAVLAFNDDRHDDRKDVVGAVYTMTNDPTGNEVVVFQRDHEGILTKAGSVSTGGLGSGGGFDPLVSQGSIVLSGDHRWVLAVNAGSDEISVFRVQPKGLDLVDTVPSGGIFPASVTVFHNLVYVLNTGGSPNITGFHLGHTGRLRPLEDSTRSLGSGGFSQVGFDPHGRRLVVTDRAGNSILVYSVGRNGVPVMNPVSSTSNGIAPFGLLFDKWGHLLVVEAGSNAVSSYDILRDGSLQVISPSVANGQSAACWIAGDPRGNVFTTNPGTATISAYKNKARRGTLVLLDGTANVGNPLLDLDITKEGRFLYALAPMNNAIDMFEIERDGSLTHLGAAPGGLSIFAQGIAVR
jgi:6-phosphogluconolactonase (cycloisomerase 2 family)